MNEKEISVISPKEVSMRSWYILLLILTCSALAIPEGVEPEPLGTRLLPCCMTRYSTPIKLSFSLGVSFNRMTSYNSFRGFFLQAEPGFGGGKLNIGYRFGEIQFIPIWYLGLNTSLLRTWGNPLDDVRPDQTYLGMEFNTAFSVIGFSAGAFKHISGDDEENDWIYSLGLGVGL